MLNTLRRAIRGWVRRNIIAIDTRPEYSQLDRVVLDFQGNPRPVVTFK